MSVTLTAHDCICLDKAPLLVDGDQGKVYHEDCEGFIADVEDFQGFTDTFWNDQLSDRKDAVVINGSQYRSGVEYPRKGHGMDGRHFKIIRLDTGEVIDTNDLWHQGTVPKEYKGILQDNAKFAKLIEVKQWNTCPTCQSVVNWDHCPFTNCSNDKFKGESIEVKR